MADFVEIGDLCTRIPALSAWNLWRLALHDAAFQEQCVARQGRRVFIDEPRFWRWLDAQRTRNHVEQ